MESGLIPEILRLDVSFTVVKITDFGLCRVSNTDYEYVSANGAQQLPFRYAYPVMRHSILPPHCFLAVRWTALECFGGESRVS
jgi:hypothetical protein